jgi:hypothetical protein
MEAPVTAGASVIFGHMDTLRAIAILLLVGLVAVLVGLPPIIVGVIVVMVVAAWAWPFIKPHVRRR